VNNLPPTASDNLSGEAILGASRPGDAGQVKAWFQRGLRAAPLFLIASILSSCAHFTSTQTDVLCDGTQRTTKVSISTFLDGKNDVTKLKTTMTDKSQGIGLAGLDQNSSSTNAVEVLRLIAQIVGAVAK
jgi:hypothetical protein